MQTAAVDHRIGDELWREIWDRIVFPSTFAEITVLIRLPIGPIREYPDPRAMLRAGLEARCKIALLGVASFRHCAANAPIGHDIGLDAEVRRGLVAVIRDARLSVSARERR